MRRSRWTRGAAKTVQLESEDAERRDTPKVQIERPGHPGKAKSDTPLLWPRVFTTAVMAMRGSGSPVRPVGVYQRDWAMEPQCSVCVLQLPSISTIAPKSLQDP